MVCYVNRTAEVKAECDLCCTSANAAAVVNSIEPGRPVIFVPDKYLGAYTAAQTGRDMILWEGYCPTHVCITPQDVERARAEHPDAVVMVHPECLLEVSRLADAVESTSGMRRFARETDAKALVLGTETGMLYRLRTAHPDKASDPLSDAVVCPRMNETPVDHALGPLGRMQHEVRVPEQTRVRALRAIEAMVATG